MKCSFCSFRSFFTRYHLANGVCSHSHQNFNGIYIQGCRLCICVFQLIHKKCNSLLKAFAKNVFTQNWSGVLIYVFFEFAVFAFEIPSTKYFVDILFSNRFARFACQINSSNQENMRAHHIWKLYDEQKIRTTKLRRMLNNSFFLFIASQRCVHLYKKYDTYNKMLEHEKDATFNIYTLIDFKNRQIYFIHLRNRHVYKMKKNKKK